ncbi:MAG: DUF4251 domain-containing protein, partial [Flavobacteriaceae bacterium]
MKMRFLLLAIISLLSCGVYGQKTQKEGSETSLETLVEAREFRIESDWARAQPNSGMNAVANSNLQNPGSSGNRFNLIGNQNFLEVKGDSVMAFLPYFGEKQFGGGHYSGQNAIEFKGVPEKISVEN